MAWYDTKSAGQVVGSSDYNDRTTVIKDATNNEGIVAAPTIAYVDDTHVSVTSVDVLIRSDAVYGADNFLYRKTVAQNTNLAVTGGGVINYIYVTYNSGTPIYAVTTSRNDINMSDAIPVARVAMGTGSIDYQLSYGLVGKGGIAKNIDRVFHIRGSGGLEIESGLTLTETATRVINVAAGYVWFGLKRITDTDLPAIVQTDGDVTSHLWYHEVTTGNWVSTPITAYNNTQYDDAVAPYAGLQTLTNTSRYAVNWVFRNVTTKEIDVVLGTGDYTLAQAEASTTPTLPPQMAAFYVLCGRIIVQKSSDTAYAIENIVNNTFSKSTTTVHSELSNLGYADAGHTGFAPSASPTFTGNVTIPEGTHSITIHDYIQLPARIWTVYNPLSQGGSGAEFVTEQLGNGIERTYLGYGYASAQYAYLELDLPEDWNGGNLTVIINWETASADGNTCVMRLYGARFADAATSDVALTTLLQTVTDTNTGAGQRNKSPESSTFTITGTGNHLSLRLNRDYATDTLDADVKILGVTLKCIRTLV